MSNIDSFLAQKYAILQQQADTAQTEARARAGLLDAQALATPGQAAGRAASDFASAGLQAAQARSIGVNTDLAPGTAAAENDARRAAADSTRAQIGLTNEQTEAARIGNQPVSGALLKLWGLYNNLRLPDASLTGVGVPQGTGVVRNITSSVLDTATPAGVTKPAVTQADLDNPPSITSAANPYRPSYRSGGVFGFSTGTSRVPGKGSGKVDTVPAKLAPGEAVLNKGAAEHLGRDTIDLLNAVGQRKMGLATTPTQKAEMAADRAPGYAGGVSSVGGAIAGLPRGVSLADLMVIPGVANGLQAWAPAARGLVPVAAPAVAPQALVPMDAPGGLVGYAAGTSNVRKGGAKGRGSKAPAGKGSMPQITPQVLAAIMGMGQPA